MRRVILLVAAALVLVVMLFVVSAGAQERGSAAAQQRATKTVSIENFAFVPARIVVRPGTRITWVNNDSAPHTVTANNGAFDSGTLQQGETFSRTFRRAGKRFPYHCEIHPEMLGKVIVRQPSS
jgi:plastocyanin